MSPVRAGAALLVLALILFPAITRSTQVLDSGGRAPQTSGFHKSVDVPPEPPVVAPDVAVRPLVLDRVVEAPGRWLGPADDRLPTDPLVLDGGALRAPPARLR